MADIDSSDIRTKVAQHIVNKALHELDRKNPHVLFGDQTYHHALYQFQEKVDEDVQTQGAQAKLRGVQEPTQVAEDRPLDLPPLFPYPISDYYSWNDLLILERGRKVNGRTKGPGGEHRFPVPDGPIFPPWYSVAIIGAGVAGLRTAKLLQDMGIPYKIFEACDRPGGRVFTYEFAQSQSPGKHDYYDVGAMRFPDNEANKKTFELFEELGLKSKLIEYVMGRDDNIRYYNGQC